MMKRFVYILLPVWLTSCAYRTLEGTVKPVYFSADTSVFNDTSVRVQAVTYQNLMGLSAPCLEVVDLQKGKTATAFIASPTIFKKDYWEYLVYPGEHIFITANDSNDYIPAFSTVSQKNGRNGELRVLKTFQELEKRPKVPRLFEYTFHTILDLEKVIKDQVVPAEHAAQLLFDSLCNAYDVTRKFKKLTKDYVHNRYKATVLGLYEGYRDTLSAHQSYRSKVRAFLPQVNGLSYTDQFSLNDEQNVNELYACLFPHSGIRNMVAEGAFDACFDSVVANFSGHSRDYLLSRLMYRACAQGFNIPTSYRRQYRHYSMNKGYRKIIARAGREYKNLRRDAALLPNELLMTDGKTKIRLENVLAQYKGRYVLVDLWASWCMPCIQAMPALEALRKKYPADQIAILSVSVDWTVPAWRNRLNQLHVDSLTSYLLLNKEGSALVKQIKLSDIPRYLLYDKEGQIINTDAPAPGEPALAELLDKLISK